MIKINESGDGIVVDNLLDCIEMLGKTAAEIGVPIEAINTESKYYIRTYVDGNIFDTQDYGILHFEELNSGREEYLAKSLWIHVKHLNYDECKIRLTKQYGNSIKEGENPFVEADGGAVRWAVYLFRDVRIRLSAASQRNYTEINVEKHVN